MNQQNFQERFKKFLCVKYINILTQFKKLLNKVVLLIENALSYTSKYFDWQIFAKFLLPNVTELIWYYASVIQCNLKANKQDKGVTVKNQGRLLLQRILVELYSFG